MTPDWKEYAELESRERGLEDELKAVKARKAAIEPQLLESMAEDGMDRITIGGITFYPRRRLYAGPKEGFGRLDVTSALLAADLGDFVKNDYNANTLAGYVRGLAAESDNPDAQPEDLEKLLPGRLRDVLHIGEVWSIGARKA